MGKSTFGNFLLDPGEHHMLDEETFTTATDNTSTTQEVRAVTKKVRIEGSRYVTLTIIDTPGLNESAEKDLSHMIQLIKKLSEFVEIRACILVIKFNAKIDVQYKATMQYYSRLLPGLFDKNVIIVMTDFATDDHSEKLRMRRKIDVDKVKDNTIAELRRCSNSQLSYKPSVFKIDCLPRPTEMETSLTVRTAIIDCIFESLKPGSIKDRMVAKTDYIKQKDAEKVENLNGQISGYNFRLKQNHKKSKEALDETEKKEREINTIQHSINDLTRKKKDKDTQDDVVAENWSIEESWKFLRWFSREFYVASPYEKTRYKTWTNGKCEFKEIIETSTSVKGKVEGKFMRGIYASVTIYTEKRQKYASEISELDSIIAKTRTRLEVAKAQREQFKKEQKEHSKEMQLLEEYIKENSNEAEKWSSNQMSIEEAMSRLEELTMSD